MNTPIGTLALLLLVCGVATAAETVSIVVSKTSVREARQFFAPAVAELKYRDTAAVLAREGDWLKVDAGGRSGWIHRSAVTSKQPTTAAAGVSLTSLFGRSDEGPEVERYSQEEVALAGKGFNEEVERDFRKRAQDADYAAVDWLEKQAAGSGAIARFASLGKLVPPADPGPRARSAAEGTGDDGVGGSER